jgi:hypothetical protein
VELSLVSSYEVEVDRSRRTIERMMATATPGNLAFAAEVARNQNNRSIAGTYLGTGGGLFTMGAHLKQSA